MNISMAKFWKFVYFCQRIFSSVIRAVVHVCAVITCPALNVSAVHPALRVKDNKLQGYRPGDQARFRCVPGYRLDRPSRRTVRCRDGGRWASDPPSCYQVYCYHPPRINHASILGRSVDKVEAGGHATYQCGEGYRLDSASNRLKCNLDGDWVRSTLPNCVKVTCLLPPFIANGSSEHERPPVAGSAVIYSCLAGFVIAGEPQMYCTNGGQWNGTVPECMPISCPPPRGIPHGTVTGDRFTYLFSVEYLCDVGYVLVGEEERTSMKRKCNESGQWQPALPVCARRRCPPVGSIEHGRTISHGDPVYGSVVEFVCNAGFRLEGQAKLTCLESGQWSGELPSCLMIFCSEPVPVKHATLQGTPHMKSSNTSVYRPGSVIRYRCQTGYEVDGKSTRSCRSDGRWTGPRPRCVAVRCNPPNSIKHGQLTIPSPKNSTTYGTTIRYHCDPGYQLDGPAVRRCSDGSQWTGSDPICYRTACEDPPPIPHGTVVGTVREIGAMIGYRCDDGHQLIGESFRNCTEEGEWSGDDPYCRKTIECDKPSYVISNGRMISSNFLAGSTIHYVCDEGYYIDGPTQRRCGIDGRWVTPIPVCERVECPRPLRPAHSRVEGFEYRFRERVTYSCRTGYQLIGPSERICQSNQTWSGTEPRCEPVECMQPADLADGEVLVEGRLYQNVAHYQCDSGYRLEGSGTRECGADGEWTGIEPRCTKITCSQPPSVEFGFLLNDEWNPGDEVQYTCDEGYQLLQTKKFFCSETGNFTGVQPRCVKIECPKLKTIPNADLNGSGNGLYDVAKYSCYPGFELAGPAELICTENNTWSAQPPSCVRITCPPPLYVPDVVIRSSGYEFGSELQYECISGFVLKFGNLSRECTENGTWSGEAPVCVSRVVCPKPSIEDGFIASTTGDQSIEQHVVNIKRFVLGIIVELDCEEGFNLVGERMIACLDNSTWSPSLPTCVRVACPEPQINNSVVRAPKGFMYGFRIFIACEEGFELIGSSEASCLSDGSWSTELPECRQLFCNEPTTTAELEIDVISTRNEQHSYPVGVVVEFRCKDGYTLEGAYRAICQHDQSWSDIFPTCTEVTCSPPLIETGINNTSPQLDNIKDLYSYGETLSFRCPGVEFKLVGNIELVCIDYERWNGSTPTCQLLVCPALRVQHGKVISANTSFPYNTVGSQITVQCDNGYHTNGVTTANCTMELSWSSDVVTACEKTLCPKPTVINGKTNVLGHGDKVSTEYGVGVQIFINCNSGFLLPVGTPSSVECTELGQWSDMLPTCVRVSCPPISIDGAQILVNGSAVENSLAVYSYGDEVEVDCLIGHSIVGNKSLICESSGAWSHLLPSCERIHCPQPRVPHATVRTFGLSSDVSTDYMFGDVIYFVCDDGFQISGLTENLCLDDGTWDAPFPRCDPRLCPELSIKNAEVDYKDREFGARVRVSCDDGYELFGDGILVCQASGLWFGISPICRQITCKLPHVPDARIVGSPPNPRSNTTDGGMMDYGDEIVVECHEGFELIGESRLMCGMNKTWSPAAPSCRRVECDDPLIMQVPHLILHISRPDELPMTETRQFVYGTEVRFSCELGFLRVGVASITCNETGEWNNSTRPTCDVVHCPPPQIAYGYVHQPYSTDTYIFGDSVGFRCDPGFILLGQLELFCQPNGEWTDKFPVCERRSCLAAPVIDHGFVVAPPSPKFEDVAIYDCINGYELVGDNNATCSEDGQWTQRPSCLLVRCPPPESVPHGTYMPTGSTYGSILRYACNRGYELHGDADHMCQANGTWSGDVPTCQRVQCVQPPPRIPHADLLDDVPTQFGGSLTVSCHEGYRLAGLPTVQCLWNGSWSHVVSSCNIISCGLPPYVRHADAAGSLRHEYNTTVRYVCRLGYRLRGPVNTSVCLANGSWSEVNVECVVIRCSSPIIPDGGQIIFDRDHSVSDLEYLKRLRPKGFQYGDRVVMSCDVDRELDGARVRVCGPDGRWNGTDPECRRITCGRPPALPNVIYNDNAKTSSHRHDFYVGHVIDVSCEAGFHVVKDHHMIICQANRSWNISTSLYPCQRTVCFAPPAVFHGHYIVVEGGRVSDDQFDFRTTLSYSCQPGYLLVGEKQSTCAEDGKWSNAEANSPTCAVVNCTLPQAPDNGYIDSSEGLSFGSNVDFHCNHGYKLIGPSRLRCRHDGQWNGSAPVCRIVSCGPPARAANVSVFVNSTVYGSVAQYFCHPGFEHSTGSDPMTRICHSDGQWTGPEPFCQRIKCPDPGQPENGFYTGSQVTFDSVVTYGCRPGYKVVGESTRRCQADRTWSGQVPACQRLECPTPRAPVNGRITTSVVTTFLGSVLEFECDLGYQLVGSKVAKCTEEEVWNATFPRCDLVDCGQPPAVDHASIESAGSSYNDVVNYICQRGFQRSGSGSIRCQTDGTWKDVGGRSPTVCERVSCGSPPHVQHAVVVETGLRYGDVIYYVCDEGYDLNGNNLLECGADARWSEDLPECERITCGVVPVIPHATTIVRRTTLGSRASYLCNRGYELSGSPYVECKPNRTWSYMDRPSCRPVDCGPPLSPSSPGTAVRYNTTVFKDTAIYYCLKGFQFDASTLDGSTLVMCGENGKWNVTDSAPECKPVLCQTPSSPVNGRVNIINHTHAIHAGVDSKSRATVGDVAEFSCHAGYQLVGDVTVTCQSDGTWSDTDLNPICRCKCYAHFDSISLLFITHFT